MYVCMYYVLKENIPPTPDNTINNNINNIPPTREAELDINYAQTDSTNNIMLTIAQNTINMITSPAYTTALQLVSRLASVRGWCSEDI